MFYFKRVDMISIYFKKFVRLCKLDAVNFKWQLRCNRTKCSYNTFHPFWSNHRKRFCIDETENITYIPVLKSGHTIRMANKEESDEILAGFDHRSEEILREGFIERNYKIFADEMLPEY